MDSLFAQLGIPPDADSIAGIRRLVRDRTAETSHLDFKQQIHNAEALADDLAALANTGGGVLIIGVGTDDADRATSLHEQMLKLVEQQVVQAARDGVDEPLAVEPIPVASECDPARGFLVACVPPSDRTPHITVRRGRVLHRVGTHNKPMTRREIGAAFAAGGNAFAAEFGLAHAGLAADVRCELVPPFGYVEWGVAVINTGLLPALDITVESARRKLIWADDAVSPDRVARSHSRTPPYLPIRKLPPESDVILICLRTAGADPVQDLLRVTWKTPDGQAHQNYQSWSWTQRWLPSARGTSYPRSAW